MPESSEATELELVDTSMSGIRDLIFFFLFSFLAASDE
jgi:hypothetical protein